MITCVKYESLHKHGQAFHAQFCLRHKCFIERQSYNVSRYNGMEYDQYDTPAALYLVYLSPHGEAWGCSRLTPVHQGSMIQDLWPELVTDPAAVFHHDVWEGTRFCIQKDLPAELRRQICRELVVGYFEAGLEAGMNKIIGVMPPFILRKVFQDAGCHYTLLGPKLKIPSGETIAAASMDITMLALEKVRQATGIYDSVIADKGEDLRSSKVA